MWGPAQFLTIAAFFLFLDSKFIIQGAIYRLISVRYRRKSEFLGNLSGVFGRVRVSKGAVWSEFLGWLRWDIGRAYSRQIAISEETGGVDRVRTDKSEFLGGVHFKSKRSNRHASTEIVSTVPWRRALRPIRERSRSSKAARRCSASFLPQDSMSFSTARPRFTVPIWT